MPDSIPTHWLIDIPTWWISFWTVVNFLLPPREVFADSSESTKKKYNTFLLLVSYYGALNLRSLTVKLYSAVDTATVSREEAKGFAKGKEAAKDAVDEVDVPTVAKKIKGD